MTGAPGTPAGKVLHRICPSCDKEVSDLGPICSTCGSKLVEIRDEADAVLGTVIDQRFEVRSKLGQGGMGTVYRAWQRSVGREVAIKLIDRSFSRDPMGVRRFLREARLASQLSQPNTVSVFDFGQADDGRLFIAMELIRGRTLFQVLQAEGAFSIERTKRIGVQICDAIEAAHALGIVHRDLKLENILILDHPPGRDLLKVLDFGLAKNIRDPGSHATESGIVVGTPRYMAPEAAMSGTSLPAGDIYALGVILGELVTGKALWDGDSLPQLVSQKMDSSSAVARIPSGLRSTIKALLEPEPDRRPTAAQARAMLAPSTEPGAGDTVVDPPEPDAGETANLRGKTDPPAQTRQLEVTPAPRPAAASTPSPPAEPSASVASSIDRSAVEDEALVRRPARRVGIVAIAGALAGVAVAAIVAVKMTSGGSSPPAVAAPRDAAVVVASSTPDASLAVTAGSAAISPPRMAVVTVHIESDPSGASVAYHGKTYKTPFDLEVPNTPEKIELTAQHKGYLSLPFTVVAGEPAKLLVLKKKPRPTPHSDDIEAVPF
ncbi:MAG TPA: protein kinase [Kofleriaceae bacterium]|nr:protein kinase [Kofleriaceae bacterium]